MSEDYAKGFKEGFAAGLEEGKKLAPKQTRLDDYLFGQSDYLGMPNTCHVCGRMQDGVSGYVCFSPRCPGKVTCGTVRGSDVSSYTTGTGANGPSGLDGSLNVGLGKSTYW